MADILQQRSSAVHAMAKDLQEVLTKHKMYLFMDGSMINISSSEDGDNSTVALMSYITEDDYFIEIWDDNLGS